MSNSANQYYEGEDEFTPSKGFRGIYAMGGINMAKASNCIVMEEKLLLRMEVRDDRMLDFMGCV